MHLKKLDISARPIEFDPTAFYLGKVDGILVLGKIVPEIDPATEQAVHNISPIPEREASDQKNLVRILPYVEQMQEVYEVVLD